MRVDGFIGVTTHSWNTEKMWLGCSVQSVGNRLRDFYSQGHLILLKAINIKMKMIKFNIIHNKNMNAMCLQGHRKGLSLLPLKRVSEADTLEGAHWWGRAAGLMEPLRTHGFEEKVRMWDPEGPGAGMGISGLIVKDLSISGAWGAGCRKSPRGFLWASTYPGFMLRHGDLLSLVTYGHKPLV
jgi:hypothetical protein